MSIPLLSCPEFSQRLILMDHDGRFLTTENLWSSYSGSIAELGGGSFAGDPLSCGGSLLECEEPLL